MAKQLHQDAKVLEKHLIIQCLSCSWHFTQQHFLFSRIKTCFYSGNVILVCFLFQIV